MHFRHCLHLLRCCLRDRQVRCRYFSHGCSKTRLDCQEFVIALHSSRQKKKHILTDHADIVPVIMAGIIGIYGLVVSVLISDNLKQDISLYTSFIQLGAGLSVGLAGLAAGYESPSQKSDRFSPYLHTDHGNVALQSASLATLASAAQHSSLGSSLA